MKRLRDGKRVRDPHCDQHGEFPPVPPTERTPRERPQIECCPACGNAFVVPPQCTNTFCKRCTDVASKINGIQHRMNQLPLDYIFVPREWLATLIDVVIERSRPEFAELIHK